MVVYGFLGAACTIATFVLVVFGFGDGNLGIDANSSYSPSAELVFRARSATFATSIWICLVLAWEVIDQRKSLFMMRPSDR